MAPPVDEKVACPQCKRRMWPSIKYNGKLYCPRCGVHKDAVK